MTATIGPDDLTAGAEWPPRLLRQRDDRLATQNRAARGDLREFVTGSNDSGADLVQVSLPWYQAYRDTVKALLMRTLPEVPDLEMTIALHEMIGGAIGDLLDHGRSVLISEDGTPRHAPIRMMYPYSDGGGGVEGWVIARPIKIGDDYSDRPDHIVLSFISDGAVSSETRLYDGRALGEVVADGPDNTAAYVVVDRPPTDGWGESALDTLIPILVELARRMSGLSWSIDANERPALSVTVKDFDAATVFGGASNFALPDGGVSLDETDIRAAADHIRGHDVVVVRDGQGKLEPLTYPLDPTAPIAAFNVLEKAWVAATGFPWPEPAARDRPASGVSIERRFALGLARCQALHLQLSHSLSMLFPDLPRWEMISAMTEDTGDPL